jgi:adenylate kinase family enzyme
VHFDFGEQLRRVAQSSTEVEGLTQEDIQTVIRAVASNALLENSRFYIAEALLRSFLAGHKAGGQDMVVLNGLPRHIDQARDAEALVRIELALVLECAEDVVRERIALNSGGDRAERTDDSGCEVARKLRLYRERTEPLIAYFSGKRVPIIRLSVTPESRPEDHISALKNP